VKFGSVKPSSDNSTSVKCEAVATQRFCWGEHTLYGVAATELIEFRCAVCVCSRGRKFFSGLGSPMFREACCWSKIPPKVSADLTGQRFRSMQGASQSDRARSSDLRGLLQAVEVVAEGSTCF
jgi:hypothetical protein